MRRKEIRKIRLLNCIPYAKTDRIRKSTQKPRQFSMHFRVQRLAGQTIEEAVRIEAIESAQQLKSLIRSNYIYIENELGEAIPYTHRSHVFTCYVCLEDHPRSNKNRVICGHDHSICKSCLEYQTRLWCKRDVSDPRILQTKGRIRCEHIDCVDSPLYSHEKVYSVLSEEVAELYTQFRVQIALANGRQHERERIRKLLDEDLVDDAMRNYEWDISAEVNWLIKHVQEEVCTIKCPHCKRAFQDFSDCFAVCCDAQDENGRRVGCGRYFCAWCMEGQPSNRAAHDHILDGCPHQIPQERKNPLYDGFLFGHEDDFALANQLRREHALDKLQVEKRKVFSTAMETLKPMLEGLVTPEYWDLL